MMAATFDHSQLSHGAAVHIDFQPNLICQPSKSAGKPPGESPKDHFRYHAAAQLADKNGCLALPSSTLGFLGSDLWS